MKERGKRWQDNRDINRTEKAVFLAVLTASTSEIRMVNRNRKSTQRPLVSALHPESRSFHQWWNRSGAPGTMEPPKLQ